MLCVREADAPTNAAQRAADASSPTPLPFPHSFTRQLVLCVFTARLRPTLTKHTANSIRKTLGT